MKLVVKCLILVCGIRIALLNYYEVWLATTYHIF